MNTLLTFHNDPAIKAKYLARVLAHAKANEIVQGTGFIKNGKVRACAVGCTLDVYDHSRYPGELGLPEWLAYLEDSIHEGLTLAQAKKWPARFLRAIPVGVDVEPVRWQLTILRMERLLPPLAKNMESYARECEGAIKGVITMAQVFLKTGFNPSAAEIAARAAWSAARSAAWSAAESAAWSAAALAARSAAEGAAGSAARGAESAAWSAA